jgi:hypothetical protein
MENGVFATITNWVFFTADALLELLNYGRVLEAAKLALPYLAWTAIGATALLLSKSAYRVAVRSGEGVLVSLLLLLGLPYIVPNLLFSLVRQATQPVTDPFDEEPAMPLAPVFPRPVPASSFMYSPTALELMDRALINLGVPPDASDEEIRRAYLKLVREHHPQFLRHAPPSTREASRQRLAEVRESYELALGRLKLAGALSRGLESAES